MDPGRIEISRKDASESDVEDEMEEKEYVEILIDFDILAKKGCACCLYVIFSPPSSEIIYNDSCPIHTEQWRRGYLGLTA